jgi:ribosome modulation factor
MRAHATPQRDLLAAYDRGRLNAIKGLPFVSCPWPGGLKRIMWLRGWDAGRAETIHGVIKRSPYQRWRLDK